MRGDAHCAEEADGFVGGVRDEVAEQVMETRSEKILQWWASVTIIIMGLVVLVPKGVMLDTGHVPFGLQLAGGIAGAVAATFYFRMLLECIFARDIRRRPAWIIFMIVIPLSSAVIYYMITRSAQYQRMRA